MISANVRGEDKVVALEWAAARDPERKMKLRWVLRSFVLFTSRFVFRCRKKLSRSLLLTSVVFDLFP